jgi:hypothetical protein
MMSALTQVNFREYGPRGAITIALEPGTVDDGTISLVTRETVPPTTQPNC